MKFKSAFLAVIMTLAMGVSTAAEAPKRPFSRADAVAAADAAADAQRLARLADSRAVARPAYMVRYPVAVQSGPAPLRPEVRSDFLPSTRWAHKRGSELWTRSAMVSVDGLHSLQPRDINSWCPAYRQNSVEQRRAFWVGMMSALAKHESTYDPRAVGGPDLWYGLLQIYPPTARSYGCFARTGEALKNPVANLNCAARIMKVTVPRDNAIALHSAGRWRGVAADWGPMTDHNKIAEMSAWTRAQSYCRMPLRPTARPAQQQSASP